VAYPGWLGRCIATLQPASGSFSLWRIEALYCIRSTFKRVSGKRRTHLVRERKKERLFAKAARNSPRSVRKHPGFAVDSLRINYERVSCLQQSICRDASRFAKMSPEMSPPYGLDCRGSTPSLTSVLARLLRRQPTNSTRLKETSWTNLRRNVSFSKSVYATNSSKNDAAC